MLKIIAVYHEVENRSMCYYLIINFKVVLQYDLYLKGDEFNGDALSNTVAHFFHIFVIVLLVECEKSWQPRLADRRRH